MLNSCLSVVASSLPLNLVEDDAGVCGHDSEPERVRARLLNSCSSCRGHKLTLEPRQPCLPDTPVLRLLFGCCLYSSPISFWAVSQIVLDRLLKTLGDMLQK